MNTEVTRIVDFEDITQLMHDQTNRGLALPEIVADIFSGEFVALRLNRANKELTDGELSSDRLAVMAVRQHAEELRRRYL